MDDKKIPEIANAAKLFGALWIKAVRVKGYDEKPWKALDKAIFELAKRARRAKG